MRILTVVLLLVVHVAVQGQQAEPLLFKEKVHDFGEITEDGGNADYEFAFTNNSGRAVKILSVQASCGCTTPGWSRDPILQGKVGFVKASFNPKGRPGYFNKSLTVSTDLDAAVVVLQIKGQVISKAKVAAASDFPADKGNLRFRSASLNLDKVFINRVPIAKEFAVFNAGEKPVHFSAVVAPAYIKVEAPQQLASREKGTIKITYDPKLRNQYGFTSDNIEIGTDDELQPVKSFSVFANVEESFPPLSAADLSKAPVLQLVATDIEMGKIRAGNTLEREATLVNAGKKDLVIHAIQENCSCVKASIDVMKIRPGEHARLKISLNTDGRQGMQQKAVTLYSNDPRNPVQRLTLTAYVQN